MQHGKLAAGHWASGESDRPLIDAECCVPWDERKSPKEANKDEPLTMPTISLATLDGSNGFRLDGVDAGDWSGWTVASAGDVNGDGFDDIAVGARYGDPGGNSDAGESYVVFGKAGSFGASLDLATLDGSNGFRIEGMDAGDSSGYPIVGAGDFNGDGYADLLIGAAGGDPDGVIDAGESYLIFGRADGFSASFDLASLDGTNGFRLDGINTADRSGRSLAGAGDINGDGFDDIVIGASSADAHGPKTGEAYVVFGGASGFAADFDLSALDGSNGFRLVGIDADDRAGWSVAGAGDVNGDGFADLIIGARFADPGGRDIAGESYVIFGKADGFPASLELSTLDGSNGFLIEGIDPYDGSGFSVASAGDFNGDGYADLVIGARNGDSGGADDAGESYVVFGKADGFSATLSLAALDGTDGFRLAGIDSFDFSGNQVASAGDFNGDGFDDLIISGMRGDPAGNVNAGESYIVFGRASGIGASFDLSSLDGTNGIRVDGVSPDDQSGYAVSGAGDVNDDGFDDVIIGAPTADPDGAGEAGESYVVFGVAPTGPVNLVGTIASQRMSGGAFDDTLSGAGGDDVLRGNAGNDILDGGTGFDEMMGGSGDDWYLVDDLGDTVVELAGEGYDTIVASVSGYTLGADQERLQLTGAADHGRGSANSDVIIGGANGDTLVGRSGDDVLFGDAGNDRLYGGGGNDVLTGGADNDVLKGRAGNDTMSGSAGNDIFFVDDAGDIVLETAGEGNDTVKSRIDYTLGANVENLELLGSASSGTGNELDNIITGLSGDQTLSGMDGDDVLHGRAGADLLLGGGGDDVLNGGLGGDTLTGGLGADTFRFAEGDLRLDFNPIDHITDFSQAEGDRIDMRGIDAISATGIDDRFTFIGDADFSGTAGELRYAHVGADTFILGDTDGDGNANFHLRIDNALVDLGSTDFML